MRRIAGFFFFPLAKGGIFCTFLCEQKSTKRVANVPFDRLVQLFIIAQSAPRHVFLRRSRKIHGGSTADGYGSEIFYAEHS